MIFSAVTPAPHLLLVDDDLESIEALRIWLYRQGARTAVAADTAGAESCLLREEVDAVLCDIHMPGNHQLQWVQHLSTRTVFPPLFLLTGTPELGSALAATNLPVAGYFVKPPDHVELASRLLGCITRFRLQRKLADKVDELWGAASRRRPSPEETAIAQQLIRVLLQPGSKPQPDAAAVDWIGVTQETIAVLEKTKGSFHSKELGALRRRLTELLMIDSNPVSAPPAAVRPGGLLPHKA